MLTTSAVEKLKDHQFSPVLPRIGGVRSNVNLKRSIADYTTPMNPQYALDRRFKWQVGLSELSYSNTVYTISSTGNVITLLAPAAGGAYTRYPGEITANEYLSPQALVTQFNTDVAGIISTANTATAGSFPADASLTLSYDPATTKMTLKHKNVGFEILVSNGSDILKMLGQARNVDQLTDLMMPPVMPITYDFLPPSDYLTKPWRYNALTATGLADDGQWHGNDWMNLQIWHWQTNAGVANNSSGQQNINMNPPASATTLLGYLAWLNYRQLRTLFVPQERV